MLGRGVVCIRGGMMVRLHFVLHLWAQTDGGFVVAVRRMENCHARKDECEAALSFQRSLIYEAGRT